MMNTITSNTAKALFAVLIGTLLWGCTTPPQPVTKKNFYHRAKHKTSPAKPSGPTIAEESLLPPRHAETPEETALLQGKLLLSQGLVLDAWQQWAPLATSSTAQTSNLSADAAWYLMVESYFDHQDASNTIPFLAAIAPAAFTATQSRIVHQLARLHSEKQLQNILANQPAGSMLTPFIQVALADRMAQMGREKEAQTLWHEAQAVNLTHAEAEARLTDNSAIIPIKIGLLIPLSDPWKSMGEHLLRAAQKALVDYRDVPIQLLVADSGNSKESSRKGMNELVSQQVEAVVGPVFHASVQPATEIAVDHGIPLIAMNPHNTTSQSLPQIFSNAFYPERQAKIMAEYAVTEKRYHRIVILAPDTEYGHRVSEVFSNRVRELGGSVTYTAFFPTDTLDFSPWLKPLEPSGSRRNLQEIKPGEKASTGVRPNFDAMFLPASAKQVRLIAPQAAFFKVGIPHVALLGTSLWNSQELLKEGSDYLNDAVFCDTSMEEKEWFRETFQHAWKEDPTILAALTYDSVAVLAQRLRDQRMGDQPWYEGWTQNIAFQGVNGPFRFLENSQSERVYHIFNVSRGKIAFLQLAQSYDGNNQPEQKEAGQSVGEIIPQ